MNSHVLFTAPRLAIVCCLAATLAACGGAHEESEASGAGNGANSPAGSRASVSPAQVANYDAVLKGQAAQAYVAAAPSAGCQAQLDALRTAAQDAANKLASGGDAQAAIDSLNAALQALGSCVQTSRPNMPPVPQLPAPQPGANGCSVSVINGQVQKSGDCSACTVKQEGDNVSVACGDTTPPSQPAPTPPDPNQPPMPAPTPPPAAGSITCSAQVVNGQVQTTGDCSKCQIQMQGDAVSVSCSNP